MNIIDTSRKLPYFTHFIREVLELSDSENYTIRVVEIVIFGIMNTITIVDFNSNFAKNFSTTINHLSFTPIGCILYYFRKFLHVNLRIFHTNSLLFRW